MRDFHYSTVAGQIAKGMQLAFFARAFAELKGLAGDAGASVELPENIDPAAQHAAFTLACKLRIKNDATNLAELYERARAAHKTGEGDEDMTPHMFGHYLAMQSMGGAWGLIEAFGVHVADAITVPHVQFGAHSLERDYS